MSISPHHMGKVSLLIKNQLQLFPPPSMPQKQRHPELWLVGTLSPLFLLPEGGQGSEKICEVWRL